MTREELKAMGLSDEQVDQVMASHGKATQKLRDANNKLSQQLDEATTGSTEQATQIDDLNKQLKAANKKAGQVDDLSKQLEAANGKLNQSTLDAAVNAQLSKAKVRNAKAARALLDPDLLKLDNEGKAPDLTEQIAALKESDGYLFDEGTKNNYKPNSGKGGTPDMTQAMVDAFKGGAPATPPAK
ncbi:phage scaffolding protein [Lacticaseibacillus sp. N501-2]|uniref:phage scaffolding protein n=1 Tax=Lacticaseibacillus salsurae TaxID=3367729 RepID=UPI0038B41447